MCVWSEREYNVRGKGIYVVCDGENVEGGGYIRWRVYSNLGELLTWFGQYYKVL